MDNLIIREATLQDLPVLLDFEQALILAERPFDKTIKEDPVSYYDIREYILSADVVVVVAEHRGKVVSSGYVHAKKARPYLDHGTYAYMGFMYTLPEFRGKGINKKIVSHLKTWALENGLNEVRLTVYHDNLPAIRAYEKAGFETHITEMRMRIE
ncbi:MAG TPA: GNAT family N-acetyltransferase [Eudoraea sp.]|nr:GNAT family N-acetyltransferase [Eudoraea sp.]